MFKRRREEPDASEAAAEPAAPARVLFPTAPAAAGPDSGIGVPPFRQAGPAPAAATAAVSQSPAAAVAAVPQRETPAMARPPFNAPSPNQPPPGPAGAGPRPPASLGGMPQPAPHPVSAPQAAAKTAERRTLVVGRGISLQGVIQDAERLVVEGTVEAQLLHAAELVVSPGGIFKGEVEVDDAEIAGTIDGAVAARGSLIVRGTGRVIGTARYRRLQVEDGGQISGRMEMIADGPGPANG